jgi:8-oxo-dGTP pyrophosphatase MutT (NUDIX family)
MNPLPPTLPNCHYRVSIKGLVLDETRTKFLVVEEDNGLWELPGGGLDHGETPHECLRREVKEEMGLEVVWIAAQPSFFFSFPSQREPNKWNANVLYEARFPHLNFTPSDECVAVRFVTADEALKLHAFSNVHEFAKLFRAAVCGGALPKQLT